MHQKLSIHEKAPVIRSARLEDMAAILSLVKELAEYERSPQSVTATLETYQEDFREGYFKALVAELDGEIVGMALYYPVFSTWRGRMMYLEDFIVRETLRGSGIGKLLFDAFIEKAKLARSILCKLQVLRWNEPAINFYKKYDVILDDEWVDVKLYF